MDSVDYKKYILLSIILLISTIFNSNQSILSYSYMNNNREILQILCVDMENKPLNKAEVIIKDLNGKTVYNGTTNSTGWIYIELPKEKYILKILWLKTPVYMGNISLTKPLIEKIQCKVYHLTIAINLLYIIPVRHAKITIINTTSEKTVYTYIGEIKIPYRLYILSAEKTLRLPAGNYTVIVEMLNRQSQEINLNKSMKIVFPYIASFGSLFILICIIIAVISCICFLITGHKRTKVIKSNH